MLSLKPRPKKYFFSFIVNNLRRFRQLSDFSYLEIAKSAKKDCSKKVSSTPLSQAFQKAFPALMDDPSPQVRQGLLLYLEAHGPSSVEFLKTLGRSNSRYHAMLARQYLQQLSVRDPVEDCLRFIHSLNYELETGVFLLSRTVNSHFDSAQISLLLDQIAGRVRELFTAPMTIREKCRILNRVLFHEYAFRGIEGERVDPSLTRLDEILRSKRGGSLGLSLIYYFIAERCQLPLEPVYFPGYFFLGCYHESRPFFIDVLENGFFRDAENILELTQSDLFSPDLARLAPSPIREVLERLCKTLMRAYARSGDSLQSQLFEHFAEEFARTHRKHAER